jgi:hypothetical protein
MYNIGTSAWTYSTDAGSTSGKTFVIDHPEDENKYLVHGCLEGPEAGVYYRGEGCILNNKSVTIKLPEYVKKLATNFTVQVTPIMESDDEEEKEQVTKLYSATKVRNNKFTVYGKNGYFYWHVHGERLVIEVEPMKSDTVVSGDGPYKYIVGQKPK